MRDRSDWDWEILVVDALIVEHILGWENIFDLMFPMPPPNPREKHNRDLALNDIIKGDTGLKNPKSRKRIIAQFMPWFWPDSFRLVREAMVRQAKMEQFQAACIARKIDVGNHMDLCLVALEVFGVIDLDCLTLEVPAWLRVVFPDDFG